MNDQGSTQDRERARTDAGLTGDKAPAPDPATAPHGVDAETGGAPTSSAAAKQDAERRRAIGKGVSGVSIASSHRPQHAEGGSPAYLHWAVLAGGVLLGLALAVAGLWTA